jgi:hypothetical protein
LVESAAGGQQRFAGLARRLAGAGCPACAKRSACTRLLTSVLAAITRRLHRSSTLSTSDRAASTPDDDQHHHQLNQGKAFVQGPQAVAHVFFHRNGAVVNVDVKEKKRDVIQWYGDALSTADNGCNGRQPTYYYAAITPSDASSESIEVARKRTKTPDNFLVTVGDES